jgi:predicted RNA-binding protein with PUA-like domain
MSIRMKYYLMKSEPSAYSIDDLARDGVTSWEGVRNYQARNTMRDDMRSGDTIFFYHSNTTDPGIVGEARVRGEAHPDESAFEVGGQYYDPKSTREHPRWYCVDVAYVCTYNKPLTLSQMRRESALARCDVLQKGSRLSVMPISERHAKRIQACVDTRR